MRPSLVVNCRCTGVPRPRSRPAARPHWRCVGPGTGPPGPRTRFRRCWPAAVPGRVVPLQAGCDAPRVGRREGLVEHAGMVRVEVVADQDHLSGKLRAWLEARDQAYLLAVPAHETFLVGRYEYGVGEVHAALAEEDWQPEKWRAYLVWGPQPATCPPWSGSPAVAGASSRPSGWPGRKWAWTNTRCAMPGAAGAGTAT